MPRKGIKVKELARALGITSRALIDRCRAEGVFVQNSITRLSPQTERVVRSWFVQGGEGDGEPIDGPDRRR